MDVVITPKDGRFVFTLLEYTSQEFATLAEAQAACDEMARFRLPGVFRH
jgi:hypothetical protein